MEENSSIKRIRDFLGEPRFDWRELAEFYVQNFTYIDTSSCEQILPTKKVIWGKSVDRR